MRHLLFKIKEGTNLLEIWENEGKFDIEVTSIDPDDGQEVLADITLDKEQLECLAEAAKEGVNL